MITIKKYLPLAAIVSVALSLPLASCNEDSTSEIGDSLTKNEVTITVDSTAYDLKARCVTRHRYDTRATTNLIGRLSAPEYGDLKCSFVSRLMPAANLLIPDSITEQHVDSMQLILRVSRGSLTGDSLAPQQLKAYRLTRQLPSDINNDFDPTGYYDPQKPIGSRSYTLSAIAYSDSVFTHAQALPIIISLGSEQAREVYRAYHDNPEVFQWPASFNRLMPGIYVEQSFGRGCVANVGKADFTLFWHYTIERNVVEDSIVVTRPVVMKDSVGIFSTAPEVLSSNNISYVPSDALNAMVRNGESIVTTPGGYELQFSFPAREVLDEYYSKDSKMSVVNALSLSIPAATVRNDYGIGVAPYMLMIKTAEIDDFFANNKVPDNKTSFYATYSSSKGEYQFSSMREYFLDLLEKDTITDEDTDFTLMPVYLGLETATVNNQSTTQVTSCIPYIYAPTMTRLYTERAMICFTFSQQTY